LDHLHDARVNQCALFQFPDTIIQGIGRATTIQIQLVRSRFYAIDLFGKVCAEVLNDIAIVSIVALQEPVERLIVKNEYTNQNRYDNARNHCHQKEQI
jgi:hypothetical protein